MFEGRILALLRPEAVVDRILYTAVANMSIGIFLALWLFRNGHRAGITTKESTGFRNLSRTLPAVIIGLVLGFIFLLLQSPPSLDPIVLLNVYAQVFTVTIAEVAICWALIGAAFEGAVRNHGRAVPLITGIVLASLFFGVYHLGHSPPFNQPSMIAFLSLVGLLTGLVFFFGRDIYATMAFHNFLGVIGVMQTPNTAGSLSAYYSPIVPLIGMALISLALFIFMDIFYVRGGLARGRRRQGSSRN
jgi:membrane protease YdiL (CAAX protease family)